jgi:hypothetical protein
MGMLTVYVLVLIINSALYSCFIEQIARYWHQAGIGLHMFYSSCSLGGTPEQSEDDPLCLKLLAEISTRDNVVMLMAVYSFSLE